MLLRALLLAALGFAYGAHAQVPDWDLDQLMRSLATVKAAHAHFVEHKVLSVLKDPLEVTGTLIYKAPAHLEKNDLTPKPERMVVDQDKLTFERDDGRERRTLNLPDYPEVQVFVESIRATLAGDRATLNRFYTLTLEGNAVRWRLMLVPREDRMRALVTSILISGSDRLVDRVEIEEADGDHSVMTIQKDP